LDGLLEQFSSRFFDARVDALAADVEELRVLPGRDADRLEREIFFADVRQGKHEQALGEDAHLLPAAGEGVGLREGQRVAGAPRRLPHLAPWPLRAVAAAERFDEFADGWRAGFYRGLASPGACAVPVVGLARCHAYLLPLVGRPPALQTLALG